MSSKEIYHSEQGFPVCQVPSLPEISIPIIKNDQRTQYLDYLDKLSIWSTSIVGHKIPKIEAQIVIQQAGVGDPDTFLVPANDRESQTRIISGFIAAKRTPYWSGCCIGNDMADQLAPEHGREAARLWKNLHTIQDFEAIRPEVNEYMKRHPELVLKMFPQDGIGLSIGRLLTTEDGIVVQAKFDQLDARGEDVSSRKRTITVEISRTMLGEIQVISDGNGLAASIIGTLSSQKGQRMLQTLQNETWRLPPGTNVLNPEFIFDPEKLDLKFFTDLVWGTEPRRQRSPGIPNMAELLYLASRAKIQQEK